MAAALQRGKHHRSLPHLCAVAAFAPGGRGFKFGKKAATVHT